MSPEIPYFEDPESAPLPGIPTVERDAVNAVIYNPVKNEVLCLDWQKFGWKTFVIGGIENDEDPASAAIREVLEETGYAHLKLLTDLGITRSSYYAAHKGEQNLKRYRVTFELESDEKIPVDDAEKLPHVFVWVPRKDVADFLTLSSQKYIWEQAQKHLP